MPLEASQTEGLWINPRWDQTIPGTFAVVIGVSKYDHLTGDDQSYGLGQLYVSALTAYHFFCWLRDEYRHPDLPLAKVWLLLAPTTAEMQLMAGLPTTGFRQPTFANCETAIGEWYAAMQELDSTVSEKSRALFFFSGHGLEVTQDKQILLPSDYLSPPIRNVNKALSTYNLYTGLRATPLPEHFFFLDACRNDHQKLRELSIEGAPVLNPCPAWRVRPDIISPVVYATGPGAAAWAPKDPQQGISVFGQALVECLMCVKGVEAWHDKERFWVTFRGVEDYMDPRVTALLQEAGSRAKQPVRIWGPAGKTPICEVSGPVYTPRSFDFSAPELGDSISALSSVTLPSGWRGPADSGSIGKLHEILQSEFVTGFLWSARVYDLDRRQWTDLNNGLATDSLTFREIACTTDRDTYQIDVVMQRDSSQWFEVNTGKNQKAACLLIGDKHYQPCYTLRFDVERQFITGLDVLLASSSQGVVGEAATLWNRYRSSDIGKEADPAEFKLLENQLKWKEDSPLAATVAALLLLRAWRPELLHDWLKNLATWFPERPDGWVIWVEQLLRTRQDEGMNEAITGFLQLEKRSLPHTSEGLSYAARQVGELLAFAFPAPENQTDEQRRRHEGLERLQARLKRALAVLRPGGFSAVFIGPIEAVTPDLILPY